MYLAESGFVAETPHDDACVVSIAVDHACRAFHPRRSVPTIVAEARVERMTLDVCLIDDVQAVLVAQIVETVIVRIVRGTNSIDVRLFHAHDVGTHVVDSDGLAPIRVMIVAVHSHEGDRSSIHGHETVSDLDTAKTDSLCDDLDNGAGRIDELAHEAVQNRIFSRPRLHTWNGPRLSHHVPFEHVRSSMSVRHGIGVVTTENVTVESFDPRAHGPSRCQRARFRLLILALSVSVDDGESCLRRHCRSRGVGIPIRNHMDEVDAHSTSRFEEDFTM